MFFFVFFVLFVVDKNIIFMNTLFREEPVFSTAACVLPGRKVEHVFSGRLESI